jgi:hypothetical protein
MVGTVGGPKLTLLPGSLILIYQGLEEKSLDQKSPGPPGWRLMQRTSSSLIVKKQEMLKNQTPSLVNQSVNGETERNGIWFHEDGDSC